MRLATQAVVCIRTFPTPTSRTRYHADNDERLARISAIYDLQPQPEPRVRRL
jgi:hypothetical protein